jgi:hypothetical protein
MEKLGIKSVFYMNLHISMCRMHMKLLMSIIRLFRLVSPFQG